MITRTEYLEAKKIVADYEKQQLNKSVVKGSFKILPTDIGVYHKGFDCKKIKKLSDRKHRELEQQLADNIGSVFDSNIDDYGYLTVGWTSKTTTTKEEVEVICKILNNL